jgi:hypothetical protein
MASYTEKVLGGGRIETERKIPGSIEVEGVEFRYVSDGGQDSFPELFNKVLRSVVPRRAKSGGVLVQGCKIRPPDGAFFHGVSYHGDIDGLRQDIEQGAQAMSLQTAKIVADKFVLRDGTAHALTKCQVEFY